jgi:NADH:ubiquinone oxidoreductase subunit B-like Fe-S oxidoreductase
MNEIIKEYICQASCKIIVNKLQRIGIKSIHIKWMNEITKDYIRQTSCKIVVNKLQKVLTYIIRRQMDEMPHWHFVCHVGMCVKI